MHAISLFISIFVFVSFAQTELGVLATPNCSEHVPTITDIQLRWIYDQDLVASLFMRMQGLYGFWKMFIPSLTPQSDIASPFVFEVLWLYIYFTRVKNWGIFFFLTVLLSWTNLFVNNLIVQRSNTFVPSIDPIYFRYINKIRGQKVLYILSRLNTYNHAETYKYLNIYR